MKTIKILIVSHSALMYTGLAEVNRIIFQNLLKSFPCKYELKQVGLLHVSAISETASWEIIPTKCVKHSSGVISLAAEDLNGQETFIRTVKEWEPDIVFAFNDPQHLMYLCHMRIASKWKLFIYTTIDGVSVPKEYSCFSSADRIITPSFFGKEALASIIDPHLIRVIYFPCDSDRFKPTSDTERARWRKATLNVTSNNTIVVGWVGRNQWRKQLWSVYEIFGYI